MNGHKVVNEIWGEDDNNLYFEIEGGFNKAKYIGEQDIKSIVTYVKSTNLVKGYTKSCGCLQKERASKCNKKHGLSNTKLFMVWQDMDLMAKNCRRRLRRYE